MTIDFHDVKNRNTYASRDAHADWSAVITCLVDPVGKQVVDIGCGGGIYTAAWAALGAGQVVGVDFSEQMVRDATEKNRDNLNVTICRGSAIDTGLLGASADIVFERALVHHLQNRGAAFREAHRVLVPDGLYIAQDRTPEDVMLPGSSEHIRGYFFEAFPRLLDVELGRRPTMGAVAHELGDAGFRDIQTYSLWETRKVHVSAAALADDLRPRTGRSILHELSNGELEQLIQRVLAELPAAAPIVEKDRWTLWVGRKVADNPKKQT